MKHVIIILVAGAFVLIAINLATDFSHHRNISAKLNNIDQSLQAIQEERQQISAKDYRQLYDDARHVQEKYKQFEQRMDDIVSQHNQSAKQLSKESEKKGINGGIEGTQELSEKIQDLRKEMKKGTGVDLDEGKTEKEDGKGGGTEKGRKRGDGKGDGSRKLSH